MEIDFPPGALPYCVFSRGSAEPRLGVGLETDVVDLSAVAPRITSVPVAMVSADRLNPLLRAGADSWRALHDELVDLAGAGALDAARAPQREMTFHLPWNVADYVDFYSSRHHAERVGEIFRPGSDPLPENWLHLPSGYHGRSSTVVVDGTAVRRPRGQIRTGDGTVEFAPTRMLDFELEVGFVVGGQTALGEPVGIDSADRHLFGVGLVNDWSARDIQAWEYVPLGPFLAKSFATSVSAWVMPMAALADAKTPAAPQQPPAPTHLRATEPWALDLALEVWVRPAGAEVARQVTGVNAAAGLYWTAAQQLAHLTSNGARLSPGDLFASGTVSGPEAGERGCLLELTRGGTEPIQIGDQPRTYLADGDEVTLRATAPFGGDTVSLGPVSGAVLPA